LSWGEGRGGWGVVCYCEGKGENLSVCFNCVSVEEGGQGVREGRGGGEEDCIIAEGEEIT